MATNTKRRANIEYAWEFLRRNPKYRDAYTTWRSLPQELQGNEIPSLEKLDPDYPTAWFFIEPAAFLGSATTVGELQATWRDWLENERNDGYEFGIALDLDPAAWGLMRFQDPASTPNVAELRQLIGEHPLTECRGVRNSEKRAGKSRAAGIKQGRIDSEALGAPLTMIWKPRTQRLASLSITETEIAVVVNVALPMQDQLAKVKEQVEAYYEDLVVLGVVERQRERSGRFESGAAGSGASDALQGYLQLLDLEEDLRKKFGRRPKTLELINADLTGSAKNRMGNDTEVEHAKKTLQKAHALRDRLYRQLALIPDPIEKREAKKG